MVNSQGCAYQTEEGGSQAETLLLALGKNSDAITLLQEGSLLYLTALLSNYGNLNSLVAAFGLTFKAMMQSTACSDYIPVTFYQIGAAIFLQ